MTTTPAPAAKSSFMKYAPPVIGTAASVAALMGASKSLSLTSIAGTTFSAIGTLFGTLSKAIAGIASVGGALPALGIAAGLLGGFWWLIGKPTTIKGLGTSLLNQFHPIEAGGAKGRLGSNLWQMPVLYFVASGIIAACSGGIFNPAALFPGAMEAVKGFSDLIVAGAPIAQEAAANIGNYAVATSSTLASQISAAAAPALTTG